MVRPPKKLWLLLQVSDEDVWSRTEVVRVVVLVTGGSVVVEVLVEVLVRVVVVGEVTVEV